MKDSHLTVEQEIRAQAMGFAVERFKNLPAASCPPDLVVASAEIYAKFISGENVGNSKKESAGEPGEGRQP